MPNRFFTQSTHRTHVLAKILSRCVCGCHVAFFRLSPSFNKTVPDDLEMKRSASLSFEKEILEGEVEHSKKITKSVEVKSAHRGVDANPSPIRVKKDACEAPQPLGPLKVNETPTDKELAAAKAARVRLGYEKADTLTNDIAEPTEAVEPKCPSGTEPAVIEVDYVPTDKLQSLENVEETTKSIVTQLGTKDWQEMCKSLNCVRQLTVHHPDECLPLLPTLVPAVLKLFKNPRSSVCKTAVLCLADMVHFLRDDMIPHLDVGGPSRPATSVLCQLLLKSCSDKHFVAEEVQKVLTALGKELNVVKLTWLLIPYASQHRNPNVRGKAGTSLAAVVERMTSDAWKEIGLATLLKTAAVLVTDRTPDAREAARIIILKIHSVFQQDHSANHDGAVTVNVSVVEKAVSCPKQSEDEEESPNTSDDPKEPTELWKLFCEEHLSMTQAIAVLKIQPSNAC